MDVSLYLKLALVQPGERLSITSYAPFWWVLPTAEKASEADEAGARGRVSRPCQARSDWPAQRQPYSSLWTYASSRHPSTSPPANMAILDQVKALLRQPPTPQAYEQLTTNPDADADFDRDLDRDHASIRSLPTKDAPAAFSWLEYAVFLLLGIAMLWAWNMFLAAAPYFARRFADDAWIAANFQSSIISASTVTNMGCMLLLAKLQAGASYTWRVALALAINLGIFSLLAISTSVWKGVSPTAYFVFVLLSVFGTSVATAFCQNGAFALASGFGNPTYTQAIMTGQGMFLYGDLADVQLWPACCLPLHRSSRCWRYRHGIILEMLRVLQVLQVLRALLAQAYLKSLRRLHSSTSSPLPSSASSPSSPSSRWSNGTDDCSKAP